MSSRVDDYAVEEYDFNPESVITVMKSVNTFTLKQFRVDMRRSPSVTALTESITPVQLHCFHD